MNISYSKSFIKSASKLTGKYKFSLKKKIEEVKSASKVDELTDCKKLKGFEHTYRTRIGDYRVFFVFNLENDMVFFEYLVKRDVAYDKKYLKALGKTKTVY